MPRNNTQNDQYALCYNNEYLHVVVVQPGLVIDTGLDTLVIRNSLESMRSTISELPDNISQIADTRLDDAENDRVLSASRR